MNQASSSSHTQLHIFSRNTDASAGMRGFEYQKLKTLASWIDTFQQPENHIYCEHEDDIMQMDLAKNAVIFRQVKLYSSKFSLKSPEIKKSIANFFMLYCNPLYADQDVQFVFETNSALIPSEVFLSEWIDNQQELTADLLERCRNAIDEILAEYIEAETKEFIRIRTSKIQSLRKEIESLTDKKRLDSLTAKIEEYQLQIDNQTKVANSYAELDDTILTNFVQRIRWEFLSITPDQAIISIIDQIEEQLLQLPYGIISDEIDTLITRLHWEVSQTSIKEAANDRLLTYSLLENIILTRKEDDDNWYVHIRDEWKSISVTRFLVAEFYEVVKTSHHCRSKQYLHADTNFWLSILEQYYSLPETPSFARRKAAYEICMLIIKADSLAQGQIPTAFLDERVAYIPEYFNELESFTDIRDIEDAICLLSVVFWELSRSKTQLTEQNWQDWTSQINTLLDNELKTNNPNYRCGLLECKSNLEFTTGVVNDINKSCQRVIGFINEIIQLLPDAPFYAVYQLHERLNIQIRLLDNRIPDKLLDDLIDLSERLGEFVGKREGD